MNELIQNYLNAEKKEEKARLATLAAMEAAILAPLPESLRPAEPKDIIEGAILWYPEHGQESDGDWEALPYWKIVDEALYPSDPDKAYCSTDGARYGLDGAFVEI